MAHKGKDLQLSSARCSRNENGVSSNLTSYVSFARIARSEGRTGLYFNLL